MPSVTERVVDNESPVTPGWRLQSPPFATIRNINIALIKRPLLVALLYLSLSTLTSITAYAGDSTPVAGRDWRKFPAIVQLPEPATLYALADVHGDYDRMIELLVGAKLIAGVPTRPDAVKWTGGNADLVLTGDMIDKYNQALSVIAALRALHPQVEAAGGHLVACLGNHEAEFLASGGDDKKAAELSAELKAANISYKDVAAGTDAGGIGGWLRNLPAGAKVGDWFFCHAGNTNGVKLTDLETELEKALESRGYSTPLLVDANSMLEARMHPRPWFIATSDPSLHDAGESKKEKKERKEAEKDSEKDSGTPPAKLTETISALGAKHLVIGHQPGKITFPDGAVRAEGQMFEHYNGVFFMIDTGMSRGVASGRGALLKIQHDSSHTTATAIYADGTSGVLWHE